MATRHVRSMSIVDDCAPFMSVYRTPDRVNSNGMKNRVTDGKAHVSNAVDRRDDLNVDVTRPTISDSATMTLDRDENDVRLPFNRHAFRPPTPTPAPTPGKRCRCCDEDSSDRCSYRSDGEGNKDNGPVVMMDLRRSVRRASLLRSARFGSFTSRRRDEGAHAGPQLKARLVTVIAEYDARTPDAGGVEKPPPRGADDGQQIAANTVVDAAAIATNDDDDEDDEEKDTGCGMKTVHFCMQCFGCTVM